MKYDIFEVCVVLGRVLVYRSKSYQGFLKKEQDIRFSREMLLTECFLLL